MTIKLHCPRQSPQRKRSSVGTSRTPSCRRLRAQCASTRTQLSPVRAGMAWPKVAAHRRHLAPTPVRGPRPIVAVVPNQRIAGERRRRRSLASTAGGGAPGRQTRAPARANRIGGASANLPRRRAASGGGRQGGARLWTTLSRRRASKDPEPTRARPWEHARQFRPLTQGIASPIKRYAGSSAGSCLVLLHFVLTHRFRPPGSRCPLGGASYAPSTCRSGGWLSRSSGLSGLILRFRRGSPAGGRPGFSASLRIRRATRFRRHELTDQEWALLTPLIRPAA